MFDLSSELLTGPLGAIADRVMAPTCKAQEPNPYGAESTSHTFGTIWRIERSSWCGVCSWLRRRSGEKLLQHPRLFLVQYLVPMASRDPVADHQQPGDGIGTLFAEDAGDGIVSLAQIAQFGFCFTHGELSKNGSSEG
jgi:hypothetical protein